MAQFNGTVEQLDQSVSTTENMADYVIVQGTKGIWTYQKWHSGIVKCWGKKEITLAGASNGRPWIELNVEFPFSFTEIPIIECMTVNPQMWENSVDSIEITENKIVTITMNSSATPAATFSCTLSFLVVGKLS